MRVLFVCGEKHGEEIDIAVPLQNVLRFIRAGVPVGFLSKRDEVEYELRYWSDGKDGTIPLYCKAGADECDVLDAMRIAGR